MPNATRTTSSERRQAFRGSRKRELSPQEVTKLRNLEWFESEDGIRAHYADMREHSVVLHRQAMERINDEERACLEAFGRG